MPRRCTPLSVLAPQAAARGKGCTNDDRRAGRWRRATQDGVGPLQHADTPIYGAEADFVGCVFAITKERPWSTDVGEVFVTADSVTSGASAGGDGCEVELGRRGAGTAGGEDPQKAVAKPPGDRRVANGVVIMYDTYRVYLTDASGTCVRLEKRIRPELARHHRILRSPPGTCCAVLNAGCPVVASSASATVGSGNTGGDSARDEVFTRGNEVGPRAAVAVDSYGFGTVCWSSMTSVGGSGGAPLARIVGGAPAGHLEPPLLGLRRWAEGGDGRKTVQRERQRLALLLARKKRVAASAVAATAMRKAEALRSGGGATSTASPGGDGWGRGQGERRPVDSSELERELALRTEIVVGFVSSFAMGARSVVDAMRITNGGLCEEERGGPDDDINQRVPAAAPKPKTATFMLQNDVGLLSLRIDTGDQLVTVELSKDSLGQLLRVALYEQVPASLARWWSTAAAPRDRPTLGSCGTGEAETTTQPTDAGGILGTNAVIGCNTTRPAASCALRTHGNRVKTAVAAANQPPCAAHDSAGPGPVAAKFALHSNAIAGCTEKTLGGHGGSSLDGAATNEDKGPFTHCSRDEAIDALTAATFRMVRQRRTSSACFCIGGCAFAPASGTAPRTAGTRGFAQDTINTSGDVEDGQSARPPVPTSESHVRTCGSGGDASVAAVGMVGVVDAAVCASARASGSVVEDDTTGASGAAPFCCPRSVETFLVELAAACGGEQCSFSVLRSCPPVFGCEVGVVEGVGRVDSVRSAEDILEDLIGSRLLS